MSAETWLTIGVAFLGVIVAVAVPAAGFVVNSFRSRLAALDNRAEKLTDDVKDIREKYVRRDDLDDHLAPVRNDVRDVKTSIAELTKLVIAAIQNQTGQR